MISLQQPERESRFIRVTTLTSQDGHNRDTFYIQLDEPGYAEFLLIRTLGASEEVVAYDLYDGGKLLTSVNLDDKKPVTNGLKVDDFVILKTFEWFRSGDQTSDWKLRQVRRVTEVGDSKQTESRRYALVDPPVDGRPNAQFDIGHFLRVTEADFVDLQLVEEFKSQAMDASEWDRWEIYHVPLIGGYTAFRKTREDLMPPDVRAEWDSAGESIPPGYTPEPKFPFPIFRTRDLLINYIATLDAEETLSVDMRIMHAPSECYSDAHKAIQSTRDALLKAAVTLPW